MNDIVKHSVINRRTLVTTGAAAIAAPAVLRAIPANAQSKVIKIGHVSPRTGPLAGFGEADNFVISNFLATVRGGLKIGSGTHSVEVIVKDSQSNPSRAADVARELIVRDKVDLMLVA